LTFPDPAAAYPAARFTQIRTPSPGQGPSTVPLLPLSLTPAAPPYRRFALPSHLSFLQPSGARRDSPTIAQPQPCPTHLQWNSQLLSPASALSLHQIFKPRLSLFSITSSLFHFPDLPHLFLFLSSAHSCTKKPGVPPKTPMVLSRLPFPSRIVTTPRSRSKAKDTNIPPLQRPKVQGRATRPNHRKRLHSLCLLAGLAYFLATPVRRFACERQGGLLG